MTSLRLADHLIISGDGSLGPYEFGKKTHLLLLEPGLELNSDLESSLFVDPGVVVDEKMVRTINAWLDRLLYTHSPAERGAIRNQGPFLMGWASVHLRAALQIERTLHGEAFCSVGLVNPGSAGPLLRAYFRHKGIPLAPSPAPDRSIRKSSTVKNAWDEVRFALARKLDSATPPGPVAHSELLIATLQPNSTRSFLPVAKALRARGLSPSFLLQREDTSSQALLLDAGLAFALTPSIFHPRIALRATRSWVQLRKLFAAEDLAPLLKELGFPNWAIESGLARELSQRLRRQMLRALPIAFSLERALKQLRPRAFSYVTHRAIFDELLHADKRGLRPKALFYLQGVVPESPPVSTRLEVDGCIVGSGFDLAYTSRCKIPRERTRVTGYPDYDHFPTLKKQACRQELDSLHPQVQGRPLFVFTSQYTTSNFSEGARLTNLNCIVECARRMPDCAFLLRLHPRKEQISKQSQREFPPNLLLSTKLATDLVIKGADALITYWSTTALEALLLNTPLVQLNATGLPDFLDLSTSFGRPIARNAVELNSELSALNTNDGRELHRLHREGFLEHYGIRLDGKAAERAASAIATIVG